MMKVYLKKLKVFIGLNKVMMNVLSRKVLLLNSSYEPMMIVRAKRAIILLYLDKVESVEKSNFYVRSEKIKLSLPSVVKLKSYIYMKFNKIPLTRNNIFQRDGFKCQYCGIKTKKITIDHIIPKDKKGEDTWSNLVSACIKCNLLKSNKLLSDTNMELLSRPKKPNHINFMQKFINDENISWKPYLFMEKN